MPERTICFLALSFFSAMFRDVASDDTLFDHLFQGECQKPRLHPEAVQTSDPLKLWWYDLPAEFHTDLLRFWNTKSRRHKYFCDVGCSICDETRWGNRGADMAIRQQGGSIAVLARLALLPNVSRPEEADFFVVPALNHLIWNAGWHWLVGANETRTNLLFDEYLVHYNESTATRHIFIGGDEPSLHKRVRKQPIVIHMGPRIPDPYTNLKGDCFPGRPWHIVVPDPQLTTFTQPDKYVHNTNRSAFVFFFGATPDHLPVRAAAVAELRKKELQGKYNMQIHTIDPVRQNKKVFTRHYALHKNGRLLTPTKLRQHFNSSRYCLVLSGDIPHQTRFYEAVHHGCVPIIVTYNEGTPNESWWRDPLEPRKSSLFAGSDPLYPGLYADSYPFTDVIPYRDFTLTVPYSRFIDEGLLPSVLKVTSEGYERMLASLLKHRSRLVYDFSGSAVDVFVLVLRRLRQVREMVRRGDTGLVPCSAHPTRPFYSPEFEFKPQPSGS